MQTVDMHIWLYSGQSAQLSRNTCKLVDTPQRLSAQHFVLNPTQEPQYG